MGRKIFLLLIGFSLVVAGCTQNSSKPTLTLPPTEVLPTATYTPSTSPFAPCRIDHSISLSSFEMTGTLAYYNLVTEKYYLMGNTPRQRAEIKLESVPSKYLMLTGFSPDGAWLAFGLETSNAIEYLGEEIVESSGLSDFYLLSYQGEEVIVSPNEDELVAAMGWEVLESYYISHPAWINEDTLLVFFSDVDFIGSLMEGAYSFHVIYNVATGEWDYDLLLDLPNFEFSSVIRISPDLTRILYHTQEGGFILWDSTKRSVVSEFGYVRNLRVNYSGNLYELKSWSPNSEKFGLLKVQEIWDDPVEYYIMDRDGELTRVIIDLPLLGYEKIGVSSGSWSFDGKYLAFELERFSVTDDGALRSHSLVILNSFNNEIIYECLHPPGNFGPFWSPDNRYIAFIDWYPDRLTSPLYILDLQTGLMMTTDQYASQLAGWSDKFKIDEP